MEEKPVVSGADCFGETRSLGVGRLDFKVSAGNRDGIFIIENVFSRKGGPAKHLHYTQDEWFYCLEGRFAFEVGDGRYTLHPGDSLLGPRGIPHVWAHIGASTGRILIAFSPAGSMEAFFREVTKYDAMPPLDPQLWRAHGMELLGPPMKIDQPSG